MNNTKRPFDSIITKLALAFSDIFFFNASVYLAYFIIYKIFGGIDEFVPRDEMAMRGMAQFCLSLVSVAWFWTRLRHYTYRKPFWFELKEIIRTLLIFAVIDLALVAFSKWNFSRTVWLISWTLIIILVPIGRALVKKLLDKCGCWKKQTIIIGSGKNAFEAYAALQSEEVLGFDVSAFYCTDKPCEPSYFGVPVISNEDELWAAVDVENTQFIVALEFEQHALRDTWLKKLATHNCRSVSVIPTLRGVPLYLSLIHI